MKRLELDVLSEASNAAIVRMPGRVYPGVVIQGDTLSILADNLRHDLPAAVATVDLLLSHYITVLDSENIPLPFNRPPVM